MVRSCVCKNMLQSLLDRVHGRGRGTWTRSGLGSSTECENRYDLYSTILTSKQTIKQIQLAQVIAGHVGCVNTVHFTEDGSLAITGSDDLTIQLHDIYSNQLKLKIQTPHRGNIFDAKEVPGSHCHQFISCAGSLLPIFSLLISNPNRLTLSLSLSLPLSPSLSLFR
jgi:WD40 repeat protein